MRKYKGAHLLRRIRRQLEQAGHKAEVSFISVPDWTHYPKGMLIETRITKNKAVRVLHHSVQIPATDLTIAKILNHTIMNTGQTVAQVEEILDIFGACLRREDGYLMMERLGCDPALVVPVTMIDLIGREHKMALYLPSKGKSPMPGDDRAQVMNRAHIECDQKRRDPKGRPRPVLIGNLFAHYLRHRTDGAEVLEQVLPSLAKAVDEADYGDGGSVITVLKAITGLPDQSLRWSIKERAIHIADHAHDRWEIDRDTLLIKIDLPQSVVAGLPGMKLGEVVSGLPFDPNLRISQAKLRRAPWSGVALKLKGRPICPQKLAQELAA